MLRFRRRKGRDQMRHEIVEKNLGLMIVLIIFTISGGFLAEVGPLFSHKQVNEPVEGLEPLSALNWKAGTSTSVKAATCATPSRSVRSVRKPSGMATTPLRASSFTTVRSCGAPSVPVRTWPV